MRHALLASIVASTLACSAFNAQVGPLRDANAPLPTCPTSGDDDDDDDSGSGKIYPGGVDTDAVDAGPCTPAPDAGQDSGHDAGS